MAYLIGKALHIKSDLDLENEMRRHNCKTIEELSDFLWINYGMVLITDYTNDK